MVVRMNNDDRPYAMAARTNGISKVKTSAFWFNAITALFTFQKVIINIILT